MAKVSATTTTTTSPTAATTNKVEAKILPPPMKKDAMLKIFGFNQSTCSFCMKTMDDCRGLLMQCAKCKDVYFCSKKCFNDNVVSHQQTCSTSTIR